MGEITIGGSDIAAVCGLNPYESSYAAWLRLTRRVPREEMDNRFTEWGKRLERAILKKYSEANDVPIRFGRAYGETNASTIRDGWKRGTEDAFALQGDAPAWGIDAKNTSVHMAREWSSDAVPAQYLLQCAWYCHVFDLNRWDLAVLIGGNEYRQFRIDRDASLEQTIVDQVTEWRERHLVRDEEPPIEIDSKTLAWINGRIPAAKIKADAMLEEKIAHYKRAWLAAKVAEDFAEDIKLSIIEDMAGAAKADEIESTLGVVKYKAQTRKTVDWKQVVAEASNAGIDLAPFIDRATNAKEIRVFNVPRSWSEINE